MQPYWNAHRSGVKNVFRSSRCHIYKKSERSSVLSVRQYVPIRFPQLFGVRTKNQSKWWYADIELWPLWGCFSAFFRGKLLFFLFFPSYSRSKPASFSSLHSQVSLKIYCISVPSSSAPSPCSSPLSWFSERGQLLSGSHSNCQSKGKYKSECESYSDVQEGELFHQGIAGNSLQRRRALQETGLL